MTLFSRAKDRFLSFLRAAFKVERDVPSALRGSRLRRIRIGFFTVVTLSLLFTMWKLVYDGPRIGGIDNVSLFFLLNLNIILLLVMAVLVVRNLVKLLMDRQNMASGARFKTKLVLSFLGLTLIPSALLFVVASGLITNSIDNWSSLTVERSLRDSLDLAQDFYRKSEQAVKQNASGMAELIRKQQMLAAENRQYLLNVVQRKQVEFEAITVAVYGSDFGKYLAAAEKDDTLSHPDPLSPELVKRLLNNEVISENRITPQGAYIFALAPVLDQTGKLEGAVFLAQPVDWLLVDKIGRINKTFAEYKELKLQRFPIKAMYEVMLLLVTLAVLFGAVWFGLYLARDITDPIQKLMEATQKVSEGDLSVRLEEKSKDEIGILVRSFNRMTEELQVSREKVETSHNELMNINLELDRRRKYIETILANIAAGVISIDGHGHIATCNPSAISILHLKTGAPLGKYYEEVFEPEHMGAMRALMREMARSAKNYLKQETPVMVDGVQRILLVHLSSLKDGRGEFMGVVVVFEDITAIINAEKTAAWREIAQHLAHEIKNPLTPIRLNTERLRRNYEQDREAFERNFDNSTRVIIQEVEVLQTLVDGFSRFAQLPVAAPEMTSLHEIIGDVVHMYRDLKPGIAIKTDYDPSIGQVRLDKEQMHRVFRNLVENAVDAVNEGGTIEIRTRRTAEGKRILIDVMDDGQGIDPKNLDKVFLPYFSTKQKGTGLGLAIVNRIVADHEGLITVKNRSPHGTLIAVDLPAA